MEEPPNTTDTAVTRKTASLAITGALSLVLMVSAFHMWLDRFVVDGVHRYANENIYPRITRNERDIAEIKAMIESSDHSRNRQYGELKTNQTEMFKVIKDIRAMGIRK